MSIAALLSDPLQYTGKRVQLTGHYRSEFEAESLSADDRHIHWRSLSLGGVSALADPVMVHWETNAWITVTGTFLHGRRGHMGLWPGEITEITRLERARNVPAYSSNRLSYAVVERAESKIELRCRLTKVAVYGTTDGLVGSFSLRDEVLGSSAGMVLTGGCRYAGRIRDCEVDELCAQLKRDGILQLEKQRRGQEREDTHEQQVTLRGTLDHKPFQFDGFGHPRSGNLDRVHDRVMIFGSALRRRFCTQAEEWVTVSEGDREPARMVELERLVEDASTFAGKRVCVRGYYDSSRGYGGQRVLCLGEGQDLGFLLGADSMSPSDTEVSWPEETWVTIVGTVLPCKPALGPWGFQIGRITHSRPFSEGVEGLPLRPEDAKATE